MYSTRLALIGSTPAATPRSVMQVAYRWIADAGYEVEYVIPDGITDVPKAQRTGCYVDDLPVIVAYKDAYYAELRQREWDAGVSSAIEAREREGAQTDLMDWDAHIESWGDRPEVEGAALDAGIARRAEIERPSVTPTASATKPSSPPCGITTGR